MDLNWMALWNAFPVVVGLDRRDRFADPREGRNGGTSADRSAHRLAGRKAQCREKGRAFAGEV